MTVATVDSGTDGSPDLLAPRAERRKAAAARSPFLIHLCVVPTGLLHRLCQGHRQQPVRTSFLFRLWRWSHSGGDDQSQEHYDAAKHRCAE
jgi:hypothetical protein